METKETFHLVHLFVINAKTFSFRNSFLQNQFVLYNLIKSTEQLKKGRKPTECNDEDMKRDSEILLSGDLAQHIYVHTQTFNLKLKEGVKNSWQNSPKAFQVSNIK